jgi:Protein of unknown function (DUF3179)
MTNLRSMRGANRLAALGIGALWLALAGAAQAGSDFWSYEWPKTDFSKTSVDFAEILSGGPPKDGIPSIDKPIFVPVSEMTDLSPTEPVVGLTIDGDARAYPLRILTWHEIVNDVVGGIPVMVTYCPLCNTAIVFDRRIDGRAVEFGTTGKLRKSNLIMYDRDSESWWQQMLGEGIVGARTGERLKALPTRLESWERFKARNPDGKVLIPNNPEMRPYGANPYVGYDGASVPFLYAGDFPKNIAPMAYVVAVANQAWSLDLLRQEGEIESGDLVLTWEAGQNSALDTRAIAEGRDIGNVVVQRRDGGGLEDIPYDVTFAFVFYAFQPEGTIFR